MGNAATVVAWRRDAPPTSLRNDAPPGNHWIKVRLEGVKSCRRTFHSSVARVQVYRLGFPQKGGRCQAILWPRKFIFRVFLCPDVGRFVDGAAAGRRQIRRIPAFPENEGHTLSGDPPVRRVHSPLDLVEPPFHFFGAVIGRAYAPVRFTEATIHQTFRGHRQNELLGSGSRMRVIG